MKNFWLLRRPRIYQQTNPYTDEYGKWFVLKYSNAVGTDLYLHKDGVYRVTTFNSQAGEYTGYFDTEDEAKEAIKKYYESLGR